jgi:PAS domain-containing protein
MDDALIRRIWEESWTYIKTVVDVVREPVVILDKELHVMLANEPFYRTFQVEHGDTDGKLIYELGNGQWDVPQLRKLLEDILPNNTFFKGFEVTHDFPVIGRKVMILNAREIHSRPRAGEQSATLLQPIILLAMEDVTDMMRIADTLVGYAHKKEVSLGKRLRAVEASITKVQHAVRALQKGAEES